MEALRGAGAAAPPSRRGKAGKGPRSRRAGPGRRVDTSKQVQLVEVLKKEARSPVMADNEGLTPAQLEQEHLAMTGKSLPPCDLGFQSALELVAAAPAVEMPSLQPSCETESFHLRAKEKSEPVETQAVDLSECLKQMSLEVTRLTLTWYVVLYAIQTRSFSGLSLVFRSVLQIIRGQLSMTLHPDRVLLFQSRSLSWSQHTNSIFWVKSNKQPQDLEQSLLDKLILTPEIPPDAVQDRNLCSLPPLERECMVGVIVGFIISPSQFYIHICSRETPDELQNMMFEIRHLYSHKLVSDRYIMPESAVRPGQLCCVTVANWWYRVIIHRVISDQEVEVFYADYGNLEIVRKSWLRFLKWCYLKLPAQAIPCSLARVKPMEDTWSKAATLLFKELCGSNLLVGIVDEYVNGILHLFLCNTSAKEDVYFHHVLADGGYADNCGENVPSQGFMELNPLALYVQPSGQQERAELVEPTLHVQQESLGAASETASSKLGGDEACDQQWQLSAKEETQDDVQPLLNEVSVLRTTDQAPELVQDTKETPAELMAVAKIPLSLEESSMPSVLFKSVEDIDTSFIYSKQPAETSQDEPHQKEPFSSKAQHRESVHPSVLLMAMPFVPDNCNDEERMKNKDLPRHLAADPCSASGLSDQGPARNLYIPPAALSAVVSSARLAAASGYFRWFPSLTKKCEERGEAGAAPEEGCLEQ